MLRKVLVLTACKVEITQKVGLRSLKKQKNELDISINPDANCPPRSCD